MKKTQVTQKSDKTNPPAGGDSKRSSIVNVAQKKTDQQTAGATVKTGDVAGHSKGNSVVSNPSSGERQLINTLVQQQKEAIKPIEIEKSLSELLSKFMHLPCAQHKIREYDHICVNKRCSFKSVISCSKCILQDEKHSIECKNDFNSLEKYVPIKVDQLSGKLEREKIEILQGQVKKTEEDVNQLIAQMRDRVDKDLNEIVGSVTALCSELKVSLHKQIDQYQSEQKAVIQRYNGDLSKNLSLIIKEGQFIEKDFKEFLTNNFDYTNFYQVNEFMKKVREKENTFSVQKFILELHDNLEEFKYDIKNNSYYKKRKITYIKDTINSLLQAALQNSRSPPIIDQTKKVTTTESKNGVETGQQEISDEDITLFDFTRLKLQGQHLANYKRQLHQQNQQEKQEEEDAVIEDFVEDDKLQEWYEGYDKKSIVMDVQKDFKDPKSDSSMISLQQRALMQTDHKLSTNSIAVINHNSFATCGNEQKVKIWGFTHNYVIHLKATIELGDLGVQVVYHKHTKCLYVATSRGVIQAYQLPDDVSTAVDLNPKLIKEYVAHERTVRNISFLPNNYNQLISLSYDKTLKVWNINPEVEQQNSLMLNIDLPNEEDCKFMDTNGLYTLIGSVSGHILIYQNVLVDLNQNQTMQSTIKSKRSERSAAFGAPVRRQPKYQVADLKFLAKLKCSKEKITSIVLGSKNPHTAVIGSGNGTISVLDLSKLDTTLPLQNNLINLQKQQSQPSPQAADEQIEGDDLKQSFVIKHQTPPEECIVFKFRHIHKQRISSLNLFEENFLLAMSWDGLANLYDLRKQKAISTTRYLLQNDEKKHSDGASAKLAVFDTNKYHVLSIGNNDKQIQVFCLQLKNQD